MPARELPPTAGLPPRWRDLLPVVGGRAALAPGLARFLGVDKVQLECSGTAALVIALATLQRLHGRHTVVVPGYTCPLVALAVRHCGLELRCVDLVADGIDFDPAALAAACDRDTLAIVPTHLGGRVAEVAAVRRVADAVGAAVIEDAAQALGARVGGASVGLVGDAGFFSLAVGKGLTTFEGGVLVARDPGLAAEFRRTAASMVPLRVGWELRRSFELLGYHLVYRPALLGLAYGRPLRRALRRGDPVAAVGDDFALPLPIHRLGRWRQAVAARALERLPRFLAEAGERAAILAGQLAGIPGLRLLGDAAGAQGTWPFLWLALPDEACRDAVLARLWARGLGVSRLFIHALPDYPCLRDIVADARVPNARRLAATSLTIGNSPWLDEAGFATIRAVLEEELGRR